MKATEGSPADCIPPPPANGQKTLSGTQHLLLKTRSLHVLLILTSLMGYLEWGGGRHTFLFQAEAEFIPRLFRDPVSALSPFALLPLAGQLLLLITLFQKSPSRIFTYAGMAGLGLLLGFMFVIGLMGGNDKILLSTLPFLSVAVVAILHDRNRNKG